MTSKRPRSRSTLHLDPATKQMLATLSERTALSQSAVVRSLVRSAMGNLQVSDQLRTLR